MKGNQEFQVWNCKYKHIPHSYIKIKKEGWKNCLSFPLMHPAQPKCITDKPILPQLEPLTPNPDKLRPFVSYLKLLDKYFPGYLPTKHSIFQMNNQPLVLTIQGESQWDEESNVGLLCYYVVHGDDDNLTSIKVQRWAELNSNTLLGKTIKEMNKRYKQKNRKEDKKGFNLFQTQA